MRVEAARLRGREAALGYFLVQLWLTSPFRDRTISLLEHNLNRLASAQLPTRQRDLSSFYCTHGFTSANSAPTRAQINKELFCNFFPRKQQNRAFSPFSPESLRLLLFYFVSPLCQTLQKITQKTSTTK